jgi:hypothetical protein
MKINSNKKSTSKLNSWIVYLIVLIVNNVNAVTYFVDSSNGNDTSNGITINTPWKNISKLNSLNLTSGDKIFLKCGSIWNGQQLKFNGSGTLLNPIVIDKYSAGSNPILNGNGLVGQGVVYLYNQQYIEINNLEITNYPTLTPSSTNPDSIFFVGLYQNATNPLGADRRGVMVVIDNYGTANHIYLKNLNIHHIKGQLGNGNLTVNGAIPKRTGGIFFTVLGSSETSSSKSRFNDVLIDRCNINYCENIGLAFDNEWNVYYPGGTEYNDWYSRRFTSIKVSNNIIHHIGKNAMIIRCTDETGLIERNVCYETALGTTGNTMFTARAKGTVFQFNEGYFNRATTQTVDPGIVDGSMYDPDFGSVGIIFQYSYSHDNSEGIYWGCNTRGANNNVTGIPDPEDVGCTLRYCISQNDLGDLVFFNYSSAGNEIYNNVFYTKSGLYAKVIHENSGNNHTYNFFNNIIYNVGNAGYNFATTGQARTIENNVFYGNHSSTEPSDVNKLISNPLFVSPGSGTTGISSLQGYKLASGSPATCTGRLILNNGGLDFFSNLVSNQDIPSRGVYQAQPTSLNLKLFIQGYYKGQSLMTPVKMNEGIGSSSTIVDDITVELRNPTNYSVSNSVTTQLQNDGTANAIFTTCPSGLFYIVIKHRNALETWSSTPLTLGESALNYDFTNSISKTYGSNMKALETGIYGFYSGDINQDGFINSMDYTNLKNDSDYPSEGYLNTDLNGDGFVESGDYPILYNNSDNLIKLARP